MPEMMSVCTKGSVLQLCNEEIMDDKELVRRAIDNDPMALQFASDRLRDGIVKTFA